MTFTIGIAPDSFKGTLTAVEAADAMAEGALRVVPDANVMKMPMADGGEGTAELLAQATAGAPVTLPTTDPLGRPLQAAIHRLGDTTTWAVDTAAASGLTLLTAQERDPLKACSAGTGTLIRGAAERGARTVVLGLGGSATVDGGVGLCGALGVRWLDRSGRPLAPGGGALASLVSMDASSVPDEVRRLHLRVAHDVQNPLLGPTGAATVFAPQKGATPAGVRQLEAGLQRLAEVLDVPGLAERPGTGAAGGIGATLTALFGATLEPGAPLVLEQAGWAAQLPRCDLVVVGEGCLDAQTAGGKAPGHVAAVAARHAIAVLGVAGILGPGAHTLEHLQDVEATHPEPPATLPAPAQAAQQLADATERLLRRRLTPG